MTKIPYDVIGNSKSAFLIGIGGAGMSGLARVLKHRGLQVKGSDLKETSTTRDLTRQGIQVYLGQKQIYFSPEDLVIYSTAISPDHLELKTAHDRGMKVCHRAQVLASIFNQAETSIGIMGTHGKTTTSSMISFALKELGLNPTGLIGGDLVDLGTNTVLGRTDLFVSEVDESDKSHELYAPSYSIITNLEEDHLDHYKDLADLESSFQRFLTHGGSPGLVIYNNEDLILKRLVLESGKPKISFGFTPEADFYADNIELCNFGSQFDFYEAGFYSATIRLSVPGLHNVANALAALVVLIQLGLTPEQIAEPLSRFRGARRRLEIKWKSEDLIVIDDYAHHPTEVRASIKALRNVSNHLTVIFQPHRFSRTQHFCKEFGHAFQEADEVILTEVYSAGEANPGKVGVNMIYEEVRKTGHPSAQVLSKEDIPAYLLKHPKGVIAFLGAGDIGEVANEFANRFKSLNPV